MFNAEGGEGVDHCVGHGRRRTDRATFADAFGAERLDRGWRFGVIEFEAGQLMSFGTA